MCDGSATHMHKGICQVTSVQEDTRHRGRVEAWCPTACGIDSSRHAGRGSAGDVFASGHSCGSPVRLGQSLWITSAHSC